MKETIASVEPAERVILAIIGGEGDFVVARYGRGLGFWQHVGKGWRHVHDDGGRQKW